MPFAVLGSGGLSSEGDIRPLPIEGRRPGGCEEELLRVVTNDVVELGKEDVTGLGSGTDPTEVVDSAGEDDRGVEGPDVLGLR